MEFFVSFVRKRFRMTRSIVPFDTFYHQNVPSINIEPNYCTARFLATRIVRTDFIARVSVCLLFATLLFSTTAFFVSSRWLVASGESGGECANDPTRWGGNGYWNGVHNCCLITLTFRCIRTVPDTNMKQFGFGPVAPKRNEQVESFRLVLRLDSFRKNDSFMNDPPLVPDTWLRYVWTQWTTDYGLRWKRFVFRSGRPSRCPVKKQNKSVRGDGFDGSRGKHRFESSVSLSATRSWSTIIDTYAIGKTARSHVERSSTNRVPARFPRTRLNLGKTPHKNRSTRSGRRSRTRALLVFSR